MLKFLTQKLKSQSLVEPMAGNENMKQLQQKNKSPVQLEENQDSENCDIHKNATLEEESDEENAEICSITKGLDPAEKQNRHSSTEQPVETPTLSPGTSRMPFRQMNLNNYTNHEVGASTNKAQESRGNNDEKSIGQGHTPEENSSEEELVSINFQESLAEKRKWSQIASHNTQMDSPGTSDEELLELVKQSRPSKFSCSPPRNVARLQKTVSPKLFLANVSPACESCWMSPRKRQRQSSESSPTYIQRPYLDLEKMQNLKSTVRKHVTHHTSKARLVKIKSFNSLGKASRFMVDPERFTFQSISTYNQLTPVEDACAH